MAKIKVVAMKDVWYAPNAWIDPQTKQTKSDGKLWKVGEEFEIEEKHFSDYDKVENIKGIVFRGSMRRVGAPEPLVVADVAPKGEAI